jgi:tRNA-2-methylthio-N6-dimethylallyladenosine synthase
MNQYEAGLVRKILDQDGYAEVVREQDADVVLLLTCCVRKHAEQRAIGRLQNLRGLKRTRPDLVLAVLGCTAQEKPNELADGLGADIVAGPDEYRRLPELIQAYRNEHCVQVATRLGTECYEGIVPRNTSPVSGMVSIMRGCNNYCAYCIVPYVRGRERSKTARVVLDEVQALRAAGVKGVTLVGQNVLAYQDGATDFSALLRLVDPLMTGGYLRFITAHPKDVTLKLAETMRDLKSAGHHLHLPVQSGSNRILEAMNRRYTREEYLSRIGMLRELTPDISLTTDLLVGFPGERDDDFEQTLELVRQIRFDFAYMFRYSERPGTRAVELEPKVPDRVARDRLARLVVLQNEITREQSQALVGREFEVLVETRHGSDMLARTSTNRTVALKSVVPIGSILTVKVTGIQGWTPVGEVVARR